MGNFLLTKMAEIFGAMFFHISTSNINERKHNSKIFNFLPHPSVHALLSYFFSESQTTGKPTCSSVQLHDLCSNLTTLGELNRNNSLKEKLKCGKPQ